MSRAPALRVSERGPAIGRWQYVGRGSKRVVVWGTGFVGKMVIAEIVKHPLFELVGVGVSNPDKVGRDVGDICGLPEPVGIIATDDVDALIALQARRAGALRPDGDARQGEHLADHALPAGRHRRVLDRDDAVGVADDAPEPAATGSSRSPRPASWASRPASPPASTPDSPTTCSR